VRRDGPNPAIQGGGVHAGGALAYSRAILTENAQPCPM
jgi:hypothetical protein